jgi:hypothetical protein
MAANNNRIPGEGPAEPGAVRKRGPRIAPLSPRRLQEKSNALFAAMLANEYVPGAVVKRGPKIAPRPAPAQAQADMNKIGGTRRKHRRRKHHRRHTKKLKKRSV